MKNIHELVAEMDHWNIEVIRERINLANEWADEIYNIVNSGKQLSCDEWEAHKLLALEYKNHLTTIVDP